MGFLIENAATRASLKSAFDHLFCKYGRDFSDDDEIDLTDLSIVKLGKHVAQERPRDFGDCYRKPTLQEELHRRMKIEGDEEDFVDPLDAEKEETYDDVFVRLSGKVKEAQIRSRLRPMMPFSPLPPLPEIVTRRPRKKKTKSKLVKEVKKESVEPQAVVTINEPSINERFDRCLTSIIQSEDAPASLCLFAAPSICKCNGLGCFNCKLISICVE